MERGAAFAVIGVSAGVLIAGSVAAVAVINAASSSPEPPVVAVVADPSAVPTPIPSLAQTALPAPSLAVSALPEIVVPDIAQPEIVAAEQPAPAQPTKKPDTTATPQPRTISVDEAKVAVLSQVAGEFVDAKATERGGYQAIAVTVQRTDGSRVTGFVEASSGIVFDWVQTQAPDPVQAAPKPQSGGGKGEHKDGHEGGEHEGGEHEGGDDD